MENRKTLFEILKEYGSSDAYPFHMPGHKRNKEKLEEMYGTSYPMPYEIDITEIDGMDNLHHAEGILKEAQEKAAVIYGARKSFFLINGSTCGLLASVFACTKQQGAILMARNCHKAVYHAAELRELTKYYLYPEQEEEVKGLNGRILPSCVEEELQKHPEVDAVLITSPTYDGMVSDVRKIAEIAHRYQKPLIVDEAHGAHYGFSEYFPENSLKLGADIVIHSLHKTLPSFTQTALLSISENAIDRVKETLVAKYLGMFETSSPSYIMMAGIDQCLTYVEEHKVQLFSEFQKRLQEFYTFAESLKKVHAVKKEYQDLSKILIFADHYGGYALAEILRKKYHLEVEMAAPGYVLALTTIFDTDEGMNRLKQALVGIDSGILSEDIIFDEKKTADESAFDEEASAENFTGDSGKVPVAEAAGYISGEYVYLYPPGIPLLVPGEVITCEVIHRMKEAKQQGFELQGMEDYTGETIRIIDIKE